MVLISLTFNKQCLVSHMNKIKNIGHWHYCKDIRFFKAILNYREKFSYILSFLKILRLRVTVIGSIDSKCCKFIFSLDKDVRTTELSLYLQMLLYQKVFEKIFLGFCLQKRNLKINLY